MIIEQTIGAIDQSSRYFSAMAGISFAMAEGAANGEPSNGEPSNGEAGSRPAFGQILNRTGLTFGQEQRTSTGPEYGMPIRRESDFYGTPHDVDSERYGSPRKVEDE